MKRHIAALDGLRGIAALCVVALHMSVVTNLGLTPPRAYLAVDFFFVLSGFVIALAYDKKLASGMRGLKFFQVRFVRLYPLIFLSLILGFVVQLVSFHAHGPRPHAPRSYREIVNGLALGLVLLPYMGVGASIFPTDPPIWSLMFEAIANAVYAIIRPFESFIVFAIVCCSAVGLALAAHEYDGLSPTGNSILVTGLPRVGFSFFVGILVFRSGHLFDRLPRVPFWFLSAALIGSFCVPAAWRFGWAYEIVVVVVLFPLIVALGAKCAVEGRVAALAIFGGRVSYPVYLLHYPLLIHPLHIQRTNVAEPIGIIVAALIVMVPVGWAASAFYDEPVRLWLNARFAARDPIAPIGELPDAEL